MFDVTSSALEEIKRQQVYRSQLGYHCRIEIKKGGCSGLYYSLEFTRDPLDGDLEFQCGEIKFSLSSQGKDYWKNLEIDYVEDLMGGTFRFNNPNVSMTCRCGLSFA